ncbi:MAG: MFS transporter [Alicyclobacillus sp.]|nr:MFS transporter [Alicyclobacillus sp.]
MPASAWMWPQRWWRLFSFTFALMLTMQIDKTNISFLYVNPPFLRQFGLEGHPAQIGLLASVFLICYGVFQIAWGPLIQKLGGRRAAVLGIVLWIFDMWFHTQANTYNELLAARIGLGVIEAFAIPLLGWYTAQWLPFSERGRGQASWIVGISLGSVITPLLTVSIVAAWGWKANFYFSALIPLIPLLMMLLYLPNEPRQAKGMPRAEVEWIEQGSLSRVLQALDLPEKNVASFRQTVSNYRVWLIALMDIGSTASFYGLSTFGPRYITANLYFPEEKMALVTSAGSLAGGLIALWIAVWSDRVKRRGWFGVANFLAGAVLLLVVITTAHPVLAACALALAMGTGTSALVVVWSLPHAMAERSAIASTIGTAGATGITISGFITAAMGGLIAGHHGSYVLAFALVVLFFVLAALSSLILALQKY